MGRAPNADALAQGSDNAVEGLGASQGVTSPQGDGTHEEQGGLWYPHITFN